MSSPSKLPFGEETKQRVAAAVAPLGLELYHADWKVGKSRSVLSLTIDRPGGGVSLADCESASRAVSLLLDTLPELPGPYSLEVSSPGLDRPLWTIEHALANVGRRVTVRLAEKLEGTAKLKGTLERVDEGALTVLDEDRGRRYTVRFDDVKLARLIPEL